MKIYVHRGLCSAVFIFALFLPHSISTWYTYEGILNPADIISTWPVVYDMELEGVSYYAVRKNPDISSPIVYVKTFSVVAPPGYTGDLLRTLDFYSFTLGTLEYYYVRIGEVFKEVLVVAVPEEEDTTDIERKSVDL